jgi:virulence-associated protein VapD
MAKTRKQITFDLDTNALKIYYPTESWNNAYDVVRRHMEKNGFHWIQGSVYVSDKEMSSYRVTKVLSELIAKHSWLNPCMRDCRETNIGKEHSKNHIFDKTAKVPTRAELQTEK